MDPMGNDDYHFFIVEKSKVDAKATEIGVGIL